MARTILISWARLKGSLAHQCFSAKDRISGTDDLFGLQVCRAARWTSVAKLALESGDPLSRPWIPAFAGMTKGGDFKGSGGLISRRAVLLLLG